MEKFKFIFKDFKKASKYAEIYDKNIQNPFTDTGFSIKTYAWVEKCKKIGSAF